MKNLIVVALIALMAISSVNAEKKSPFTPEQHEHIAHFLNMELYVIETTLVKSKKELIATLGDHLNYQIMLENKGIMFGAGPLATMEQARNKTHPTGGMIIIRANSIEEAKEIADADPFHAQGIRTYTMRKWTLNEGSFNFKINVSNQTVEIN